MYAQCLAVVEPCCPTIFITGADQQSSRMGYYHITDISTQSKSVYRHSNGGIYLYYWDGQSAWLVGPGYLSSSAGMVSSVTYGSCPSEASSWSQHSGDTGWTQSSAIQVECIGKGVARMSACGCLSSLYASVHFLYVHQRVCAPTAS